MIARTVRRQRPHSDPAPHILATCLVVVAPFSTALQTCWLVTPTHRHTNIAVPGQSVGSMVITCDNAPTNGDG